MEYYMNNKLIDLITELTIIANKLDQKGHTKKADELEQIAMTKEFERLEAERIKEEAKKIQKMEWVDPR